MKVFCFIFGIYLLFLSSFSCTDEKFSFGNTRDAKVYCPDSGTQHEDETCSPLCVCSCCGSLAITHASAILDNPLQFELQNFLFLKNSFPQEVCFSVWQPPRLS